MTIEPTDDDRAADKLRAALREAFRDIAIASGLIAPPLAAGLTRESPAPDK